MNKEKFRFIQGILLWMLAYLVIELPFHMTDLFGEWFLAGPITAVLFLAGLMFGVQGLIGSVLGYMISICVTGGFQFSALLAVIFIVVVPHVLWYLDKNASQAALRSNCEFLKFTVLAIVTALGNGCFAMIGNDQNNFVSVAGFSLFWCIVAGMPSMILMTSILGIPCKCRSRFCEKNDLEISILPEQEHIALVNDQMEELGMKTRMDLKQMFRMMACLEELLIRIIEKGQVTKKIEIGVKIGETMRILIKYQGKKYNPLRSGRKEIEEELLGLKIVMQMSLRASYSHCMGENEILIVM